MFKKYSKDSGWGMHALQLKLRTLNPLIVLALPMATPSCPGLNTPLQSISTLEKMNRSFQVIKKNTK
jgi:hypothetical protein